MPGNELRPQAVVLIRPVPGMDFPRGHVINDSAIISEIYDNHLQNNVVAVDGAYASAHVAKTEA